MKHSRPQGVAFILIGLFLIIAGGSFLFQTPDSLMAVLIAVVMACGVVNIGIGSVLVRQALHIGP